MRSRSPSRQSFGQSSRSSLRSNTTPLQSIRRSEGRTPGRLGDQTQPGERSTERGLNRQERRTSRQETRPERRTDRQDSRQQRREELQSRRDDIRSERREWAEDVYDEHSEWHEDYWNAYAFSAGIAALHYSAYAFSNLACAQSTIIVSSHSYYRCGPVWYDRVYYQNEVTYVQVPAPTGAEITQLSNPTIIDAARQTYYISDHIFYQRITRDGRDIYVVVDPPLGVEVTRLPEGAIRVSARGGRYYRYGDVYYRQVNNPVRPTYVIVEAQN